MNKYFIITVDTEGEGGWSWKPGNSIHTENSLFIPRFQKLCEKYQLPPVYLTNWEMANDRRFIEKAIEWENLSKCEIGMHLHAWSNPPDFSIDRTHSGADYLIEYGFDEMAAKFQVLYDLLTKKIGHTPYSHRAGRWAMDDRYFKILEDHNILVDCSFTPGINWSNNKGANSGGSDYSTIGSAPSFIGKVLEVPMTIKYMHPWTRGSIKHKIKCLIKGKQVWLRPAGQSTSELFSLIESINRNPEADYLEFMIHSNELMPGGSPYFTNQKEIEELFNQIEQVFQLIQSLGYKGVTLKEYYGIKNL